MAEYSGIRVDTLDFLLKQMEKRILEHIDKKLEELFEERPQRQKKNQQNTN